MKVLICTQMFPKDGNLSPIISGMVKNPYNQTLAVSQHVDDIDVITTSDDKFESSKFGFNVYGIGTAPLKGVFKAAIFEFKILLKAIKLFRSKTYDVIHIHHLNIPLFFLLRRFVYTRTKIVYTAHGTSSPELNAARQGTVLNHYLLKLNGYLQHFIDALCWRLSDYVILPSEYQRTEMLSLYGVPSHKMSVIHNGFDGKLFFHSDHMRRQLRNSLGIPPNEKVLLYVGRAAAKKGILELIECCKKLRLKRKDFRLLLVVGFMGRQKSYRDEVKDIANSSNWIIYRESITEQDLPLYYNAADLCVFPSIGYESLPTVIFEAAACGKQILTQGAWGITEAINANFISEESILNRSFDGDLDSLLSLVDGNNITIYENFDRFSWKSGGLRLHSLYTKILG